MDFEKFEKKEYFVNRELSWLKFDERVLSEARDKNLPLFDRLKFLSITASNLDEFFMVRVASLKDQVHAGYHKTDIAGMTAKEQLKEISVRTHELVHVQYNTLNRSLIPALEKAGMHLVAAHENLTEAQSAFVDRYFEDNVYPVLTPMAMDSSRPFPLIRNKTLNIGALISKKEKSDKLNKKDKAGELLFATVQVPSVLPRVVQIPSKKDGDTTVILLEEIIERNIDKLFLSYDVICAHPYRIMRNADLTIDEDEAEDLLVEIQRQLKKRQWGEVIRLEVEDKMDERLLKILKTEFDIKEADIFEINGPLDLTMLMKVYGADGFDAYKTPRYQPAPVPEFQNEKDIFQVIREGDVFLHHPYMSFDPVVNFVRQAAKDPDVLAIKQTLYRVSGNSPIIAALAQAAENGKQVSVLVELKARFDEENNIVWGIAEVKRRIAKKEQQQRLRRRRIVSAVCIAACFAVIVGVSFAMPGIIGRIEPGTSSGFETAATILGGSTALGYMVIGLLAFVLGACVTILCFRIHQLNKEEQTEKQKEDNGDGADQ